MTVSFALRHNVSLLTESANSQPSHVRRTTCAEKGVLSTYSVICALISPASTIQIACIAKVMSSTSSRRDKKTPYLSLAVSNAIRRTTSMSRSTVSSFPAWVSGLSESSHSKALTTHLQERAHV
ncbi:hypothetical protein D3C86_1735030 [compost metagenome]